MLIRIAIEDSHFINETQAELKYSAVNHGSHTTLAGKFSCERFCKISYSIHESTWPIY